MATQKYLKHDISQLNCCWIERYNRIYFILPVVVVHVLLDGGLARPEHVHELGPLEQDGALDEVPGDCFDSLNGFKEGLEWYHWFGKFGFLQKGRHFSNDL